MFERREYDPQIATPIEGRQLALRRPRDVEPPTDPNTPTSYEEIAGEAIRCWEARAGAIHAHNTSAARSAFHVIDHPVVINPNAPGCLLANELFRTGGWGPRPDPRSHQARDRAPCAKASSPAGARPALPDTLSEAMIVSEGVRVMPAAHPPKFRRRALDVVAQGNPVAQTARGLGISESCLWNWMSRDGIDFGRKPGLADEERKETECLG